MIALDLIASLGGMIIPGLFDFVKKKFIKEENDTPERTIGSLATTKPEVLPEYINALVANKDAECRFFNRDVIGTPSSWVVNLRAAIRPVTVVISLLVIAGMVVAVFSGLKFSPEEENMLIGIRLSCESNISAWIGSRFSLSK